jgi:cytochrome c oxidase subunit 1/cytochrome c oxidase subunit I+III
MRLLLLLLINVVISLRRGKPAGDNPWGAPTLEWSVSSPPPAYNFAVIPTLASRHPLWEDQLGETSSRSRLKRGLLLDRGRETIATSALDGEPNLILEMPGDNLAPLLLTLAMSVLFTAGLFHVWWLVALAAIGCMAALVMWLWPSRRHVGLEKIEGADRG